MAYGDVAMFSRMFKDQLFASRPSFHLGLAVFAFNIFVVCLFSLLSAIFDMPNPVTQIAGKATLDDAKGILMLSGFWAIGNSLLLLGLIDAMKPKDGEAK